MKKSNSNLQLNIYELLRERAREYNDVQKIRCMIENRRRQKKHLPEGYDSVERLKEIEKGLRKEMGELLVGIPLWEGFLKNIRGVGEVIASTIIGEICCKKVLHQCKECKKKGNPKSFCKNCKWETVLRTPQDFFRDGKPSISDFYSYCGYGNNPDGSIKKRERGKPANWNNFLKTALWKFAQNQIKQGRTYREYYDKRKRYEEARLKMLKEKNIEEKELNFTPPKSKLHIH
ncbi:hypothetical protein J7L09_01700, partial [bacterium]|nr:hypothetical protein [bacterium]